MATRKSAAKHGQQIMVTGDYGKDRFIYLQEFPDQPANLREAWVNASRFWTVPLDGGSGCLIQLLKESGVEAFDPCELRIDPAESVAESIYILTKRRGAKGKGWNISQSIVAGEREFPASKLCDTSQMEKGLPAVVLDFNQGWLKRNNKMLHDFLRRRPFVVRTHDPRKKEWVEARRKGIANGIWFSPIQDMDEGSLWILGNWENLYGRLISYLRNDETLWDGNKWLDSVVIQISYDGALVLHPALPKGELLIYKGDQPGSFLRENYGTVLAGGIVFVMSLAEGLSSSNRLSVDKLLACATAGLFRLRQVVKAGYVGPEDGVTNWMPPTRTNLPIEALRDVKRADISAYRMSPPKPDWETACDIVCGSEDKLREKTVFKLGHLITSSPDYADTLLRLAGRLDDHVQKSKGVFSFCIFGGPGSGKSFIAEQIAGAVDPEARKFEHKTFNISQFSDQGRLIDAFKQVQTISLKSKIPFILWDEFDTYYNGRPAGWLPSFLMPMQDASFFDGTTNLSLGKCVFVFIGGTFRDEKDFSRWASKDGRVLKGPDFHSRLDSSLNAPAVDLAINKAAGMFGKPDPAKLVRAVLIRAFLKKENKLRGISQEVLAYLLHVPLRHGVRSLQKIIVASSMKRTSFFQPFHLPPLNVLELHVDETDISNAHDVQAFLRSIGFRLGGQGKSLELEWRK